MSEFDLCIFACIRESRVACLVFGSVLVRAEKNERELEGEWEREWVGESGSGKDFDTHLDFVAFLLRYLLRSTEIYICMFSHMFTFVRE